MAKEDFKVIIAGTRDFADYELLKEKCDAILSSKKMDYNIVIVSGTARGADRLGERYARERGYRIDRHPADWDRDGNSAGPIRNALMADNAHALIAFWDGRSRGTMNMIRTAKAKGLMVRIVDYQRKNVKQPTIQHLNLFEAQHPKLKVPKTPLTEVLGQARKLFGDEIFVPPVEVDLGRGKEKIATIYYNPRDGGYYKGGTMNEITTNIFDKQDIEALTRSVRDAILRKEKSDVYNLNNVEVMDNKKNEAGEVKQYKPGDVIESYEGEKSKHGIPHNAFFLYNEESGINSWEVGIGGKRIEICVDKDDCHLTAQDMLDKYMPQYRTDEMVGILKDRATNPAADGFTPEQKETIEGYFGAYGNDSGRERAAGYVLGRLESTVDESLRKSAGMSAAIEEFRAIGNVAPIQSQTTVTGYDAENQAYYELPINDKDEYIAPSEVHDAAINQKLGQLRQMLGSDDFTLTDADNSAEAVIDFEVGHYFDDTYSLSPVLSKSGKQAPKEYDYDGLLRELNNKLNAVRPKKYTADFLLKHSVKAIEVDVQRNDTDPSQNKVSGVRIKDLLSSSDHVLMLAGAKIIDANIDWGDGVLETGKENPAEYLIGDDLHEQLGKELADKILSMKESGTIPYPAVSDDAALLNDFYAEKAYMYVDQAKEAIISRTTSPSARQFETEQQKSILPAGMRLSPEERTALFDDLWQGAESKLASARIPDAWKQSAHDELLDLAKNGPEQHQSNGLRR